MTETGDARFELLEWDSRHFGFGVGRLHTDRFREKTAIAVESWCKQNTLRVVYLLLDLSDTESIQAAQAAGFVFMDIRMSLGGRIPEVEQAENDGPVVRPMKADDIASLIHLARTSHRDSRFYADAAFPRERCDRLYEKWLVRSFQGYADAVFVAEEHNEPQGYITCHLDPGQQARIGLMAVHERARGRGFGSALLRGVFAWARDRECRTAETVTQGRNVNAQRLYQSAGFRTQKMECWLHYRSS